MKAVTDRVSGPATSPDVEFGPGVEIRCPRVRIGAGCRLGVRTGANFRSSGGVRIECDEFEAGPGTVIEPSVLVEGGRILLGPNCRVGTGSTIRVRDELRLGAASQLGPQCTVEGRRVRIGRELWTGPDVRIGGGSWSEVQSELVAGWWCHLGMRAFVNTARRVVIGNEVGIGTDSAIFTHGSYQSALAGYPVGFAPVTIEDNCWIPGAVINPGVTIGRGAVIGVGSVVTKSVPAGALAAGTPCRVIRENAFPRPLSAGERRQFFAGFLGAAAEILADVMGTPAAFDEGESAIRLPDCSVEYDDTSAPALVYRARELEQSTVFALDRRRISGPADRVTEKLRDLLRRYGIRFHSEPVAGAYQDWPDEDLASPAGARA